MQPGQPDPGPEEHPYGQAPQDPFANPPAGNPYAPPDNPYATPGNPYPAPGTPYPTSGNPYEAPTGYPGTSAYPPYQGIGTPPPVGRDNAFGLISMILGIAAIPMGCCFGAGSLFGIAAIVLGVLGMRKAAAGTATNRGFALTGVICGGVGVLISIGLWLLLAAGHSLSNYTG